MQKKRKDPIASGEDESTQDELIVKEKLTLKQELFCQNYVINDVFRGNATLSYADAYWYDMESKDKTRQRDAEWEEIEWTSEYDKAYNCCAALASRLLKNVKIQDRNIDLWNDMLSDRRVDARLWQIIYKWKDEHSLWGIREYNKLKNRITDKIQWDITILTPTAINIIKPK